MKRIGILSDTHCTLIPQLFCFFKEYFDFICYTISHARLNITAFISISGIIDL